MDALQDWLSIRPFDPRNHVKAFICAIRGEGAENADDVDVQPALIARGVERC